jgi:uncharacterized protein (UPF0218 family)
MKIIYNATPELSSKLKEPFGVLIEGTSNQTMDKLREMIADEKPQEIISVGDVVSKNLHASGFRPLITVIDNISLRTQSIEPTEAHGEKTVNVKNPQGTITQEAATAIKQAIENDEHTHIIVDGEEDLLTLIAVLYAPQNSFVIYGQPHMGIVVVKVTSDRKAHAQELLNAMKFSKS